MKEQKNIVKIAVIASLALLLVVLPLLGGCAKEEVPTQASTEKADPTLAPSTKTEPESTSESKATEPANPPAPLDADFAASPLETKIGKEVEFSHVCEGGTPPYSCEWDFNYDGTVDSTKANPTYAYSEPGAYTVSLKITDAKGKTDTEVKQAYVSVPGVVKIIDSPSDFPTGLTWDGEYLWNADYMSEKIYKIDPDDGRVIKSFAAPRSDPEGLAWDGGYIWHVDGGDAYKLGCERARLYIYKIDPRSGDAIRMFEAPGPGCNAEDLAWDGDYLWYLDGASEAETKGTISIYQIDPDSGEVVKKFSVPGNHPSGIAWDGSYLWLSDYMLGKIYKINADDGKVIESLNAPSSCPSGLAWDGTYLWCADFHSDKIYKIYLGN